MKPKQSILILSTGNSVRSQMAEGWMKYYAGGHARVFSAGTKDNKGLNKLAHHLMMDSVIDIGNHTSDKIDALPDRTFDHVILLDKQTEPVPEMIRFNCKHAFFLDNPLLFKEDEQLMVQKFVETRNKLDDFCFQFIHKHIRNLIPTL